MNFEQNQFFQYLEEQNNQQESQNMSQSTMDKSLSECDQYDEGDERHSNQKEQAHNISIKQADRFIQLVIIHRQNIKNQLFNRELQKKNFKLTIQYGMVSNSLNAILETYDNIHDENQKKLIEGKIKLVNKQFQNYTYELALQYERQKNKNQKVQQINDKKYLKNNKIFQGGQEQKNQVHKEISQKEEKIPHQGKCFEKPKLPKIRNTIKGINEIFGSKKKKKKFEVCIIDHILGKPIK